LSAILLTHEHRPRAGVERLVRRHRLPVYLTAGTRQEAASLQELPEIYSFACGSDSGSTPRDPPVSIRTTHGTRGFYHRRQAAGSALPPTWAR